MKIISDPSQMQAVSEQLRHEGKRIGVIPTMGYLHKGHLSLVEYIKPLCDIGIMTIFVNPTQFGAGEDFDKYPRDMDRDRALAEKHGIDILFTPDVRDMYAEGYATYVNVEGLTDVMCGPFRPGHFRGVTTIVAKLFNMTLPHSAVFGQKDYQQAAVIKRMTRDLNLNVDILTAPIVREADGLAMSSRNVYLTPDERQEAVFLYRGLLTIQKNADQGVENIEELKQSAMSLIAGKKNIRLEYIHIGDADTLEVLKTLNKRAVAALAARIGKARLIDNVIIDPKKS